MADNTLTIIRDILKELYPDNKIQGQFEDLKIFYNDIEKTADFLTYGGKQAILPLRVERSQGHGSRAENGDLPLAASSNFDSMTVTLKYHYGRIYLTGQTIKMAQRNNEAFANYLTDYMDDQMEACMKQYNWQLHRASTGVVTQVNDAAVSAETTFTVDSVKGLRVSMAIDVHNGSAYEAQGVIITDINDSTKVVTVDTAVTLTDNAYIYVSGNKDNCMNGLYDGLATSGTYHAVDRDTLAYFRGNQLSAAHGTPTKLLFLKMKQAAEIRGITPKYWLTTPEIKDEVYLRLFAPDQRYTESTINGLYKTYDVLGIPVLADNDAYDGRIVAMAPQFVKILQDEDGWNWAQEDGEILSRVSGKDAFEGFIRNYSNMAVTYPKALPYADGVTTTSLA